MVSEASWPGEVSALFSEHRDELRRFVARLVKTPAEVDDVVQSSLETLLRRGPSAADSKSLMFGIAANHARHAQRSRTRFAALQTRVSQGDVRFEAESPERAAELSELRRDFRWATSHLSDDQQQVVTALLEGLSAVEVAKRASKNDSTIRGQWLNAKRHLNAMLKYGWLVALAASLSLAATAAYREWVRRRAPRPVSVIDLRAVPPPVQNETVAHQPPPLPSSATPPPPTSGVGRAASPGATKVVTDEAPPASVARKRPPPPPGESAGDQQALYDAAHHSQFVERDYADAITRWDSYLAKGPAGPLADDARFFRAAALFKLGRLDQARHAVKEALGTSTSAHRDELLELDAMLVEPPH